MQRTFLPPPWPGSAFEMWSKGWIERNFWRTQYHFGSKEDALQECALIYVRCCRTYSGRITSRKWLMALFKTAVSNDWQTFSTKDTRYRDTADPRFDVGMPEGEPSYADLAILINDLSPELRKVLSRLAEANPDVLVSLFSGHSYTVINRRLNRFYQTGGISDLLGELRTALSH